MTLPSFTSSRPSAQTTPQKCREQSESARRPSEFLCRISLGQSAIWLKFCVFILCTKICRAYPKEFIESASFAAAAGASAHANAQHGVPVRRRSNSIGTFADLFFMLFSIISMPFWRDWSANGVGSKKSKIENSRLTVFSPVQRAVAPVDFKATHTRLTALKSSTRAHLQLTSSLHASRTCRP